MLFVEEINVQLRTNSLYKDLSQIQEMFRKCATLQTSSTLVKETTITPICNCKSVKKLICCCRWSGTERWCRSRVSGISVKVYAEIIKLVTTDSTLK